MTLCEALPREQIRERSIPVLETKRLALRAPRLEDAKTVATLANDRRIAKNTARIPHPYKMSDAEGFISGANKAGGEAVFLITLRDKTVIGACGVRLQDETPELGYWLGVPHWGNGYATEAARAARDWAFETVGVDRLISLVDLENARSLRVAERLGATQTETVTLKGKQTAVWVHPR